MFGRDWQLDWQSGLTYILIVHEYTDDCARCTCPRVRHTILVLFTGVLESGVLWGAELCL